MNKIKEFKTTPELFQATLDGKKLFDVRERCYCKNITTGMTIKLVEFLDYDYKSECENLNRCKYWEEATDEYAGECSLTDFDVITEFCDKTRYRCTAYTCEKYSGREILAKVKDVFDIKYGWIAFTFEIVSVVTRGKYNNIIEET